MSHLTESSSLRSEQTLNAILNTTTAGIITITSNGTIHSFNPAIERLFGYYANEIADRNLKIFITEPFYSKIINALKVKIPATGIHQELICSRKDGSHFPVDLAISAIEGEGEALFVGILTDITQQKKTERDLPILKELVSIHTAEVQAIVQASVTGIVTINEQGIINIFNPAAEQIFGYQTAEVVGHNVSLLMPEPHHSSHDGYLQNFLRTGQKKIIGIGREVTGLRKDGSTFPMYLAVGNAVLANGSHLFVGLVSDITQYKLTEHALREAKKAAESAGRVKSEFIANMSHEIRTPMHAILGFSEIVLQDTRLASETEQHIRTIYSSAKSLLTIINDILDVSKLESGKLTLEAICFHLPNAITDALRTVDYRATEKNLVLNFEYDIRLPLHFLGDPYRLRQVILNLVGNAIKFTDKGGVTLLVEAGNKPDMLHFSVCDSGIGMTPEQVSIVFEPFAQGDSSITRHFGGTGLGTTIAKQIIDLMEGEIWVDSTFGTGSTFHFTAHLPQTTSTEGCLYEKNNIITPDYVSPRLFNILLAEDIKENATLAILRLGQQGHSVHWVQNGYKAIDAFKATHYDLILMDVQMPELDGLNATRAIRLLETESGTHIPILALTASVMREDYNKCIDAGMDDVVAKPTEFNELFATMERIVPFGQGIPRTTIQIATDSDTLIDFSSLDDVVDYAKGLKNWHNPTIYAKALHSFATEHGNDAEKILNLLAENQNNEEPARKVVHALKGVAGNLAIIQLVSTVNEIDMILKSGHRQNMDKLIANLHQALAQVSIAIGNLRLPLVSQPDPINPFDQNVIGQLLTELCNALAELNPDAVEPVLAHLNEYLSDAELSDIRRKLDEFDFDEAIHQSRRLAEKLNLHIGA